MGLKEKIEYFLFVLMGLAVMCLSGLAYVAYLALRAAGWL